jgi:hypothetical protein
LYNFHLVSLQKTKCATNRLFPKTKYANVLWDPNNTNITTHKEQKKNSRANLKKKNSRANLKKNEQSPKSPVQWLQAESSAVRKIFERFSKVLTKDLSLRNPHETFAICFGDNFESISLSLQHKTSKYFRSFLRNFRKSFEIFTKAASKSPSPYVSNIVSKQNLKSAPVVYWTLFFQTLKFEHWP